MKSLILFICILIQSNVLGQDLRNYEVQKISVEDGLPESEVYHAVQDAKGYIWFATNNGLSKFNGRNHVIFDTRNGLPTNSIYHLFPQNDSSLVGVCSSGQFFRIKNNQVSALIHPDSSKKYINSSYFPFSFYEDEKGIYHIGTRQGLLSFDKKSRTINKIDLKSETINQISIKDLPNNHFFGYLRPYARSEKLILTTDTDTLGVFSNSVEQTVSMYGSCNSNFTAFHTISKVFLLNRKSKRLVLKNTDFRCIGVSIINNQVFALSEKKGVYCYQINNDELVLKYQLFDGLSVSSIFRSNNGVIYLTTLEDGVKVINLNHPEKILNSPDRENITYFNFIDSTFALGYQSGRILIYPNRVLKPSNSKVFFLSRIGNTFYVIANRIFAFNSNFVLKEVTEFPKSFDYGELNTPKYLEVWRDSLLFRQGFTYLDLYNFNTETLSHILHIKMKGYIFQFELINDLVYLSTFDKVYSINPLDKTDSKVNHFFRIKDTVFFKNQRQVFGVQENMKIAEYSGGQVFYHNIPFPENVNRSIHSLYHNKILHISTNNGVYSWKIDQGFKSFELINFEAIPMVQFIRIRNDSVYLVTKKQVYRKALKDFSVKYPEVRVLSMSSTGRSLNPNSTIQLEYSNNEFEIEMDMFSFEQPFLYYRYKLEGYETDYRFLENGKIKYSSLPSGNYTFRISATSDGVNYSPEQIISIEIKAPFWQTWWFWTFIICTGVIFLYVLMQFRIRGIKKRAVIDQTLAELRSQALVAQLNPHLVFNVLNSIQGMVSEGQTEAANVYIAKFSQFMRNSLDHSKEIFYSVGEEIEMTKSYIELENLRFPNEIDFEFRISISDFSSSIPPLIVQPLIENSIKHGIRPGIADKGYILISFTEDESNVIVRIEDNGVGIDNNQKFGDGMRITLERVQILSKENQLEIIQTKNPTIIQIRLKK